MAQVSKTRTPGTYIDDLVLDLGVAERKIRKSDEKFKGSHIVVEVFNGNILVVGQVPSEELKEKAGMELKKLKNIGDTKIHNYLQIAPPTTMLARTNDTFITTKVKTRLFASGLSSKNKRPKYKIKVLTEDGNVYLMGLIDQKDSESITSTVKAVYGVRKIIKLFNELN
jgi:osmotically-inducible protein OsmY